MRNFKGSIKIQSFHWFFILIVLTLTPLIKNIQPHPLEEPQTEAPKSEIPGEPFNPDDYLAGKKYTRDLALGLIKEKEPPANSTAKEQVTETLSKEMPTLWKHGRVPYEVSPNISTQSRAIITAATAEISAGTCIKFVSRITAAGVIKDDDYLFIQTDGDECTSYVGRQGGKQITILTSGCLNPGTVMHELMHVLGFEHEHQRKDRDEWVTIVKKRIIKSLMLQFDTIDNTANTITQYDYGSILHYSERADCKSPCTKRTIIPKKPYTGKIGQRKALSPIDKEKIVKTYKCKGTGPMNEEGPTGMASTFLPPISIPGGMRATTCEDFDERCDKMDESKCGKDETWINYNCRKKCNNCDSCIDYNSKCEFWAGQNLCKEFPEYMLIYCPLRCGVCHP